MKKIILIMMLALGVTSQAQSFDFACEAETFALDDFIPGAISEEPQYTSTYKSKLFYKIKTDTDEYADVVWKGTDTKQSEYISPFEAQANILDGWVEEYRSAVIYNTTLALSDPLTTNSIDPKYNTARVSDINSAYTGYVRIADNWAYDVFAKWSEGDTALNIKIFIHTESTLPTHKKWTWGLASNTLKLDLYNVLNLY